MERKNKQLKEFYNSNIENELLNRKWMCEGRIESDLKAFGRILGMPIEGLEKDIMEFICKIRVRSLK